MRAAKVAESDSILKSGHQIYSLLFPYLFAVLPKYSSGNKVKLKRNFILEK